MRRFELYNCPETPKFTACPSNSRSKAIAVPHKGQKVIAMGSQATVSFTISCRFKMLYG